MGSQFYCIIVLDSPKFVLEIMLALRGVNCHGLTTKVRGPQALPSGEHASCFKCWQLKPGQIYFLHMGKIMAAGYKCSQGTPEGHSVRQIQKSSATCSSDMWSLPRCCKGFLGLKPLFMIMELGKSG